MAELPTSGAYGSPVDEEAARDAEAKAREEADEELIEAALKRFELAKEAERETRALALEDLEFISGKQWPDQIRYDRELDGRPCLVVNRLPQVVQQVTNDQRQNRPAIKVHPLDSAASKETAEVIEGIVRHIQNNSNAEVARDTAFEAAARSGFGFYRVTTDYVSPDSFDQDIYIKRIRNQFSTYLDPFHQEPDGSDSEWGFVIDDISKDAYIRQFPESKLAQRGGWESFGNSMPEWVKSDSARIAEYFYKEYRDGKIYLLKTGETVQDEQLSQRLAEASAAGIDASVVRERAVKIPTVKWAKISATDVLARTDWPGSYIPIIPVYGNEYFIDGKRILEGIVRNAKDPQRMLNFWKSAEAEAIALAPRAPFIGYEGQFEGHESEWKAANRKNYAYLEVKSTTLSGQPAPLPQRSAVEPAVQAMSMASQAAAEDVKATTGVYDPSLGAPSNEVAGVAIKARNRQSQTSNFHLTDNLTLAIKHEGRIVIDLIPKIYDAARAARIIGPDAAQKIVMLNQPHKDENGKDVLFDVTAGRYDVSVDAGPNYATKREEAAASMMDFARVAPQVAQYCSDLIARRMDWDGADEIADRIKKTLPPALQDDGKQPQIPPQAQAIMQHLDQQNQALQQELNEATKVIETKRLEIEHKERVEIYRAQVDAEIQLAKLGSTEAIGLLQAKLTEMEHRLKYLNVNAPVEAPSNFDPSQADGGNYPGVGHIGGTANLTGGASPGLPVEGNSNP